MKHANNLLRVLSAVFFCTALGSTFSISQSKDAGPDNKVGFRFGFAARVGPENQRQFVVVAHDTVMHSKDSLKMVIELEKPCFVYVIYHSADGELSLKFPYSFAQFTKDYSVGKNYFIPKGQDWMWLDQSTGKETFYVLASEKRLTDLEALFTRYLSAIGPNKAQLVRELKSEIRKTKKQYRTFATDGERPINIGGNVRGLTTTTGENEPDVTDVEVDISARIFYSKTFTIDHEK